MGTDITPREHKLHLGAMLANLQAAIQANHRGIQAHPRNSTPTHPSPPQSTPVHPTLFCLVLRIVLVIAREHFTLPLPSHCHSTNPGLEIVILLCKFTSRAAHS